MERSDYKECAMCRWLVYDYEEGNNCPQCKQGTLRQVVELEGKALDGDRIFRLDEQLALTLNEFVGKEVIITIRER